MKVGSQFPCKLSSNRGLWSNLSQDFYGSAATLTPITPAGAPGPTLTHAGRLPSCVPVMLSLPWLVPGRSFLLHSSMSCSCAQANHVHVQPGLDLIPALARHAGPLVVTHWTGWTCPSSCSAETYTVCAGTKPHVYFHSKNQPHNCHSLSL